MLSDLSFPTATKDFADLQRNVSYTLSWGVDYSHRRIYSANFRTIKDVGAALQTFAVLDGIWALEVMSFTKTGKMSHDVKTLLILDHDQYKDLVSVESRLAEYGRAKVKEFYQNDLEAYDETMKKYPLLKHIMAQKQ